jgi:hypothetical protein
VSTEPGAGQFLNCFNRVQVMVDKAIAQRDVEYLNELLSKETDENRRTVLLRLLADAEEKLRQAEEQGPNARAK